MHKILASLGATVVAAILLVRFLSDPSSLPGTSQPDTQPAEAHLSQRAPAPDTLSSSTLADAASVPREFHSPTSTMIDSSHGPVAVPHEASRHTTPTQTADARGKSATSVVPVTPVPQELEVVELDVPFEATVPAAFFEMPGQGTTDADEIVLDRIALIFAEELKAASESANSNNSPDPGNLGQEASDPSLAAQHADLLTAWEDARTLSDEWFRSIYGHDKFLQYNIEARKQALEEQQSLKAIDQPPVRP